MVLTGSPQVPALAVRSCELSRTQPCAYGYNRGSDVFSVPTTNFEWMYLVDDVSLCCVYGRRRMRWVSADQ